MTALGTKGCPRKVRQTSRSAAGVAQDDMFERRARSHAPPLHGWTTITLPSSLLTHFANTMAASPIVRMKVALVPRIVSRPRGVTAAAPTQSTAAMPGASVAVADALHFPALPHGRAPMDVPAWPVSVVQLPLAMVLRATVRLLLALLRPPVVLVWRATVRIAQPLPATPPRLIARGTGGGDNRAGLHGTATAGGVAAAHSSCAVGSRAKRRALPPPSPGPFQGHRRRKRRRCSRCGRRWRWCGGSRRW